MTVHGTAVVLGGTGLLLRGSSGAGKSTLALALLGAFERAGRFARLVADDRVQIAAAHGRVVARPPAALAGRIEVAGVGLVPAAGLGACRIALVADLVGDPPRLPAGEDDRVTVEGIVLPRLGLWERNTAVSVAVLQALLGGDGLTGGPFGRQRPPVENRPWGIDGPAAAPAGPHRGRGNGE